MHFVHDTALRGKSGFIFIDVTLREECTRKGYARHRCWRGKKQKGRRNGRPFVEVCERRVLRLRQVN